MGISGRNVAVHVNGTDLSGYFSKVEDTWEHAMEPSTTFGPSVIGESNGLTIQSGSATLDGFWDSSVGGVLDVLNAAIGASTNAIASVWFTGDAVGNRGFGIQADDKSVKRAIDVNSLIKISAEFKSSSNCMGTEDMISLRALSTSSADGTGTIVDNGAATSSGGTAYLQHSAVVTSNIVTLRHSTDNFGADDTLLGTFTTVTAANKSERIVLSGTIKRYVRVAWDLTGGNVTFGVGLHRNLP